MKRKKKTVNTVKSANYVPKVGGEVVPAKLIGEWYSKLKTEGFSELESINAHGESRWDVPIRDYIRQHPDRMQEKVMKGDFSYFRAASMFVEIEDWDHEFYSRTPYAKRIWELHSDSFTRYTRQMMALIIEEEFGVKLKLSQISYLTTYKIAKRFKAAMKEGKFDGDEDASPGLWDYYSQLTPGNATLQHLKDVIEDN